jgi:hypothetical protein
MVENGAPRKKLGPKTEREKRQHNERLHDCCFTTIIIRGIKLRRRIR